MEKSVEVKEVRMAVDWTKPIQHRNGELCELVESNVSGWTHLKARADGSYPTRRIHRLGIDESTMSGAMSAHWYVHEDGKVGLEEYDIVNRS